MLFDPLRRASIVVQNGDARIAGDGIVRRGLIRREAVLRQCGNVNVVGVDGRAACRRNGFVVIGGVGRLCVRFVRAAKVEAVGLPGRSQRPASAVGVRVVTVGPVKRSVGDRRGDGRVGFRRCRELMDCQSAATMTGAAVGSGTKSEA